MATTWQGELQEWEADLRAQARDEQERRYQVMRERQQQEAREQLKNEIRAAVEDILAEHGLIQRTNFTGD